MTLLYAATVLHGRELLLIDEPELSLHIDWQRDLLARMSGLAEGKQLIVATHAPEIGMDHETVKKFMLLPMKVSAPPDPLLRPGRGPLSVRQIAGGEQ